MPFRESLACVRDTPEGKFGFVDHNGQFAIPAQFSAARSFVEGLAAVDTGAEWMCGRLEGGRWGYVDRTGEYIVPPNLFDARDFSDGLAAAQVAGLPDKAGYVPGGKWGYLDRNGSWAIKPTFDRAESFARGIAKVQVGHRVFRINRTGVQVSVP